MIDPDNNVRAFLDTIAFSEIGPAMLDDPKSDNGYRIIVGSTPTRMILAYDYSRHPRIVVTSQYGRTDAAGRYQIMAGIPGVIMTNTWDWASKAAGVSDFSPTSQDQVCIYLIQNRGALDMVRVGRFSEAITACSKEWASLPGAGYGQHENAMASLQAHYVDRGGKLA